MYPTPQHVPSRGTERRQAPHSLRELLTAHQPLLKKLAALLLEKEVVEGEELRRIIHTETKTGRTNKGATIHQIPALPPRI